MPWSELRGDQPGESTAVVKARVVAAQARQLDRQRVLNARLEGAALRAVCRLPRTGESLLGRAVQRLGLSARAVTRVLRVARTIADLDGASDISDRHLAEALQFRLAS